MATFVLRWMRIWFGRTLDRARGHRPRVRESPGLLLIYLALPVLFIAFNPVDSYFERLREVEA